MTIRRMRRKMRKALSRGRQLSGALNLPKTLEENEPMCKFYRATHVTDKGWFEFQGFAIALEESFGINISDIEADALYTGTIEEAIPWIRERMKNPMDIVGGVPVPKKSIAA